MRVILLDEKYELLNTMDSAIQAVIYSLNAHMTGVKISEATRQRLARRKAEGMILGRPVGSKNYTYKLTGKDHIIDKMLAEKKSKSAIARKLKVHRCTLITWLKKEKNLFCRELWKKIPPVNKQFLTTYLYQIMRYYA